MELVFHSVAQTCLKCVHLISLGHVRARKKVKSENTFSKTNIVSCLVQAFLERNKKKTKLNFLRFHGKAFFGVGGFVFGFREP